MVDTITLPINLDNGNQGRSGHYGASAKRRKEYEALIRTLYPKRTPYPYLVDLTVTRVLGRGQRLYDADSILRSSYKEVQDALVACGFFVDDSPRYIRHVDGRQNHSRRSEGPSVQIEIREVTE